MKYLLVLGFMFCWIFSQDEILIEPESGEPKDGKYTIENFPGPW